MLLTPTRMRVLPLEPETSNRVVRHFTSPAAADDSTTTSRGGLLQRFLPDRYQQHPPQQQQQLDGSCFLRVSLGEEHGDRLFGLPEELVEVYGRFEALISSGACVAGGA